MQTTTHAIKLLKVGTVKNPLKKRTANSHPVLKNIEILYPSRLNAMAIDPSKILPSDSSIYTPGEIVFAIKLYRKIRIEVLKSDKLLISKNTKRKSLIKHAFLLMKKAIGFRNGFYIDIDNQKEIKHAGLGSSGCLIAGVASAINEIYGNPIEKTDLVRYLAQNHGEEIEGRNDLINPVQCIGGSAAAGNFDGGLIVIAGQSSVVKTMDVPEDYDVVIGIPKDFHPPDSRKALDKEIKNIAGFINCGKIYGPDIAYNIIHKFMPAMVKKDMKTIGNVIYDYRYNMGSIKNCSFLYRKLPELTEKISYLKKNNIAEVLSISSVGPGIFAITKNADKCIDAFQKNGMNICKTKIENGQYKIIKKTYFLRDRVEYPEEKSFWNNPERVNNFIGREPSLFVKKRLMKIKNCKNKKALDLGCGGGRYTQLLAELGYDVCAIDTNAAMINATKNRLTNFYNKDDIENRIKQTSILQIAHQNKYFDVIVSTGVFHQAHSYSEYEKIIKEASRVLKRGGVIITEIFTSRIIDPTFKFAENVKKDIVITNEGLYMTLLSKKDFIGMMKKNNLLTVGKPIEKEKDIETGKRCLLQAVFVKR